MAPVLENMPISGISSEETAMTPTKAPDAWNSGGAYELYVGRWSRVVARPFLDWLALPAQLSWADVGCGTGALTSTILTVAEPAAIAGIDASAQFVEQARQRIGDPRARFSPGDATRLPWPDQDFDCSVSGLVLNFVPDHVAMVREMARVTKPGGTVALYVWDYTDGMQMMRAFWDAAAEVDPAGTQFDESRRFPICKPEPLCALFQQAGLTAVTSQPIDIATVFCDFDDYWRPFLGRTGAAPAYLATLAEPMQQRIRARLATQLQVADDGPIAMKARAWAVRGGVA